MMNNQDLNEQSMDEQYKNNQKMDDNDMNNQTLKGDRDKLVGRVQERYGHSKEDAERDVDEWRTQNNY